MYLTNIFIENLCSIDKFSLKKDELFYENWNPKPIILLWKNWSWKTTILSSISDALYELSANSFDDITINNGLKRPYYKISWWSNLKVWTNWWFTFLKFENEDKNYEYLDMMWDIRLDECNQKTNGLITLSNNNEKKQVTETKNDEDFKKDFLMNSYCVFPFNRFEKPHWFNSISINEAEEIRDTPSFTWNLNKKVIIQSSFSRIKPWILDLFLDSRIDLQINADSTISVAQDMNTALRFKKSIENIENILSQILGNDIKLDLNYRKFWYSRIKVLEKNTKEILIPSLDNLSSWQSILLSIFSTIIKYSDDWDLNKSIHLEDISWIVVIDEIDLHLHIELQKNVLPKLIKMFPKIQFIISSHSPFFLSWIKETYWNDALLINMPLWNTITDLTEFEEFDKAFETFSEITNDFKNEFREMKDQIESWTAPLIMCEWKTDVIHLKKAIEKLGINDLQNIEFFEVPSEWWWDSKLKNYLTSVGYYNNWWRKIIGIFDRDVPNIVSTIWNLKEFWNNVYGFCIPIPEKRNRYNKISIEFYYDDENLKKRDENWNCLYFDNELSFNRAWKAISILDEWDIKDNSDKQIFDQDVWEIEGIYSKGKFAELVENNNDFTSDFNFDDFNLIINKIRNIINWEITNH